MPGTKRMERQPSVDQLPRLLDALRSGERAGRGEALHPLAAGAAQELVDRHAERLAEDVPEGDVDRRDGGADDLAALEVGAAVQRLPEVLDPARVLADQEAREVLEHPLHRQLAAGDAALADAADPLVGLDLDDELVADADLDRIALDRGDLHALSRVCHPAKHGHCRSWRRLPAHKKPRHRTCDVGGGKRMRVLRDFAKEPFVVSYRSSRATALTQCHYSKDAGSVVSAAKVSPSAGAPASSHTSGSVKMPNSSSPSEKPSPSVSVIVGSVP